MPSVHTMRHESSHVEHNYGCVYMQTAPGWRPMPWIWSGGDHPCSARCLTWTSGRRPWPPPCWALGSSREYQSRAACPPCCPGPRRRHTAAVEKQQGGNCWHPSDRTTRCWCSLPGTMALPTRCSTWEFHIRCWSAGGHHPVPPACPRPGSVGVTTQSVLAFWATYPVRGQARGPPSKPVCRLPDQSRLRPRHLHALLSVSEGDGDKPYLQIEVDEHFSPVGVITRIEAFLQSLEAACPAASGGLFPRRGSAALLRWLPCLREPGGRCSCLTFRRLPLISRAQRRPETETRTPAARQYHPAAGEGGNQLLRSIYRSRPCWAAS